ncbi:NUDIX domain-containing protein [Aliikangiella sp. IMCC44359]|uniref:NUDIX domain-containing protein n=1 Tax=Aliikangiella sp. IMCC44359 TaxID=3459125 RepID=UPI00403A9BD2
MKKSKQLKFEVLDKEHLYDGFFKMNRYTLRQQLFQGGWSGEFQREVFERGHAAAVLLYDPDKESVALVEQFRPGAIETEESPWIIELVAGMIEEGEKPAEVVCRESLEEAGCAIKRLRKICEYLVSPGGATERIWLYIGEMDSTKLPEFGGLDDENEDIRIVNITVNKAFDMLENGQLNNGMTLIALQWLKINWPNRVKIWENSEIGHKKN